MQPWGMDAAGTQIAPSLELQLTEGWPPQAAARIPAGGNNRSTKDEVFNN
jgi:hypothetical protein